MRRKGSFSSLFPSSATHVAPAEAAADVHSTRLYGVTNGSAVPPPTRLSLSLPLSPRSSPREFDDGSNMFASSDAAALDRAVADVLSASSTNSSSSSRYSSHTTSHRPSQQHQQPAPLLDGDTMQGYMVIHAKKPKRKKLFTLNRSYFVVADAARPVLEVFANETRAERVYLFSLAGAQVDFETDDVSHAVRAKCFCLNVQSWRKRGVDYLRPQGFVFYQEDQALMMVWVKCIHVAIRRANANASANVHTTDKMTGAATNEHAMAMRFRRSEASTVGADDSATESERVADADADTEHDESEREFVGASGRIDLPLPVEPFPQNIVRPPSAVETTTALQSVVVALPAPRSPRRTRGQSRRRAAIDPTTSQSANGQTVESPSARTKPPHFPRLNTMLATMKSASHSLPLHLSTTSEHDKADGDPSAAVAAVAPTVTATPSSRPTKPPSSFSPPSIMSSLHMPRGKSSSSRHVAGIASPTGAGKRLSDPFQFRKKEDTLFGTFSPFFSPRGGPRSAPKQSSSTTGTGTGNASSVTPVTSSPTTLDGAPATAGTGTDADGENGSALAAGERTPERRLSTYLARIAFLLVAFAGGVLQLSVFLPVAAAGVFVYAHEPHADAFASAAVAACWVHVASSVQGSLGLCSIAAIVYGWSYADFRAALWRRRRRLAERLLEEEESGNFAHIQFPAWAVRPDVDRVDWLNKVLTSGWPYMKIAIRNSIMDNLNPVLETSRPAFMSSLSLVRVDLGTKVPVITGVKFVSANAKTEQVTLDVDVRVMSDETLVAELRMVSTLGAAAVVSLRDLLLAGTLRVTLSPLATYWPCFSALSLCFTERPLVDFSLTAAKINLSNVPFASEWLQTFLHDLLLDYFVWPKVLDIPLWDDPVAPPTSTPGSHL